MSIYNNWIENARYSFSTVPQGILPLTYSNVTLMAVCGYNMAKMAGGEAIYAQWRKIYPTLVSMGIVDDPSQYQWLPFQTTTGQVVWMASPWIEGTSVTPVEFRQQLFTLTNTNDSQIQQVKNFLNAIQAQYTTEPII